MTKSSVAVDGIGLLVKRYKKAFRIPENLNHYSKEDFKAAERKFLKWALQGERRVLTAKPEVF